MSDAVIDDLVALLPPLLQSLEGLGFVARYFHPPDFEEVMRAVGAPDAALAEVLPRLQSWPDTAAHIREPLQAAGEGLVSAFAELRKAPHEADGVRTVYRALRHGPRAQEALYPLARGLPPLSSFFLEASVRDDAALQARLGALDDPRKETGIIHGGGEPGARGAYTMYVPEYYDANRDWPLVFALHGGSGNGRSFLWSWVRAARSLGAIVVAPTAVGGTWALMGDDVDSPNLHRILAEVQAHWRIDPSRLLLTGMSDGGTFSYVSGLEPASPFTHLAPVAAAFHPMLAQAADPGRLRNLPIHVAHGALDWMFPVDLARRAERALTAAGARVTYRELEDLSHCYPVEISAELLAWMGRAPLAE